MSLIISAISHFRSSPLNVERSTRCNNWEMKRLKSARWKGRWWWQESIYGKGSKKPNPKLCNHSLKDIDWRRGQDKAIFSNWNITDHLTIWIYLFQSRYGIKTLPIHLYLYWNIILLRRYQAKHRSLARRLARTSSPSSSWHLHSSSSSIFQQLPELSFENVQMIAPSVRTLVSLDPVKALPVCLKEIGWKLWKYYGGGGSRSLIVCVHMYVYTRVSLYREI